MIESDVELSEPPLVDASEVMEVLLRDHRRLGAVLQRVESEFGSPEDLAMLIVDRARGRRVLAMLHFLHEYSDRVHHPLESRLFDRLIEKGLTPSERRVVFVIMSQHEEILGDLLSLQEALRSLQQHPSRDSTSLKTRAERYLEAQKRHLQFEDSQLLPLIHSRLTARDWHEMERELSSEMTAARRICEADLLPVFHAILDVA